MIRVLHSADWHLDSPVAPGGPPHRRQELLQTAERIFALAEQEKVDIILLSGDLFDNAGPHRGTAERLARLCADCGKPIFITPGNHDYYCSASPYCMLEWPRNVTIFTDSKPTSAALPALGAVISGYAFTERHRTDDPLEGFVCKSGDQINIVVGHGDVTENPSDYGPLRRRSLEQCGADYIALGHIHQCSDLNRGKWQYPGCPDGRGFSETGDKCVIIAEVDKNSLKRRAVSTGSRRYLSIAAEAGGSDYPVEAVELALNGAQERDIIRLTLTGQSGPEGVDILSLLTRYGDRYPYLTVTDNTVLSADLWEKAGADTVRGQFLTLLRARFDCAGEEERQLLTMAARFGLAALEGREPPMEVQPW